MSCLRSHFRDRGPREEPSPETEAMNSAQEHEAIELQENNVEESNADHHKTLNGQTREEERNPWKSCRNVVFWKCELWMVITTIFVVIFLVILISLYVYSRTLEVICGLPHFSSEDITKRLTEVYSSSPALGRYFRSAEVISFSNESSTVIYQLVFSVPPSTEGFMENSMNPDFIRNILRQNIYDEDTLNPGTSECDRLKLNLTSLT
ncbi:TPA-induced transmembrane protein isoform X2 [Catharus ustulatus]|uniref:TPA-induced transmembrane protein isoform X2 n=1 Tax=Catharus ustulatus TaxID=91951 RepID=UPI00140A3A6E|nr:TPA-induced transmembrane protein isoform X2 [Catharus ustulatus]